MSKKMKFVIGIIVIVILVGLFFGVSTIYKFFIMQKIYKGTDKNIQYDNFHLIITLRKNGIATKTEMFYRNGIGKQLAENGIYTWVDGEEAYVIDENNKTIYDENLNTAIGLVSYNSFATLIPGYSKSKAERFFIAGNMLNKAKTVRLDNEKCYLLQINEENIKKTVWIEKVSFKPIRAKVEFPNGDIYEYLYELKFKDTTLKNIEFPDITDYTAVQKQEN